MWFGCINSGIFCTDDQAFCAYSIQTWKKRLPVGISDHFSGKKIVGDDRPSLHFSALFLFITPSRVMEAVFSKIICVPEMSSVCCTVTGKSMNSIDLLQMDPKISKFILPNLLLFTGLHSMCFNMVIAHTVIHH